MGVVSSVDFEFEKRQTMRCILLTEMYMKTVRSIVNCRSQHLQSWHSDYLPTQSLSLFALFCVSIDLQGVGQFYYCCPLFVLLGSNSISTSERCNVEYTT